MKKSEILAAARERGDLKKGRSRLGIELSKRVCFRLPGEMFVKLGDNPHKRAREIVKKTISSEHGIG